MMGCDIRWMWDSKWAEIASRTWVILHLISLIVATLTIMMATAIP